MNGAKKKSSLPTLLCACLWLTGCITHSARDAHDNLDAVVWQQASSEYAATTVGIYQAAARALDTLGEAGAFERPQAIVLDVDETVLDNVPYQGQLVIDDATYAAPSWDAWIALRDAEATPGVVEFIRRAQLLDYHVVFITNRACRIRTGSPDPCPQHADTLANLAAVGIDTGLTTLMLRGERPPARCELLLTAVEGPTGTWSSDKTSRRACVEMDRNIAMLFGDQLGDFTEVSYDGSGHSKTAVIEQYEANWGTRWFMLPNPTYGGWKPRSPEEKRALLEGWGQSQRTE